MDFFEHQDRAKRASLLLLAFYPLVIAAVTIGIYFALRVGLMFSRPSVLDDATRDALLYGPFWLPNLLKPVAGLTTLIILTLAAYKSLQLRDGPALARMLGGTPIAPETSDPAARRLRNVVEEMALASGLPVPWIFVLEQERGINALVSGYGPHDATVTVTRGALDTLTRDELQGVVAHEFSHIQNGDMRLNMRLTGLLFGIGGLAFLGSGLLRGARYSGSRRNGGVLIAGLGLWLFGSLGALAGGIVRAAVSRQREFLADASAVQFTRNPAGIVCALRKLAGRSGSRLLHPAAPQIGHMPFGATAGRFLYGFLATHPPLRERIRRIDPEAALDIPDDNSLLENIQTSHNRANRSGGIVESLAPQHTPAPQPFLPGVDQREAPNGTKRIVHDQPGSGWQASELMGLPTREHIALARALREAIPRPLAKAAHTPLGACATVFSLLLDIDPGVQGRQLRILAECELPGIAAATRALAPHAVSLEARLRLPLATLTELGLTRLSAEQFRSFCAAMDTLTKIDGRMTLFEWMLSKVVTHRLRPRIEGKAPRPIRHFTLGPVAAQAAVLLSTLARLGHRDEPAARQAFNQGAAMAGLHDLELLRREDCGLRKLDMALQSLVRVVMGRRRILIDACAATLAADGLATVAEVELLRGVCAMLDCSMPPLLPGQRLDRQQG